MSCQGLKVSWAGIYENAFFWFSSVSIDLKNEQQTSQNNLVRVLFRLPARTRLENSRYEKLGWLKVNGRVKQIKLWLVQRIVNGEVPRYFRNYFHQIRNTHSHSTRGSISELVPMRCESCMGRVTFLHSVHVFWKCFPGDLKLIEM